MSEVVELVHGLERNRSIELNVISLPGACTGAHPWWFFHCG